jgi:error-prone DNA polymerase
LIAYASAFLKNKHPAAFLAGLLNAYPMGFYTPATLVKDAQRHGVEVRPIDVMHSHWRCTLETPNPKVGGVAESLRLPSALPVRLGLRYVNGLRREAGLAIEAERATASFTSAADFAKRVRLRGSELDTLAELGALAYLDRPTRSRRSALWQIAALERDPSSLFAGITPANTESPLPEMSPLQETLADYRHSGITTGPQILAHLRPALRARGILSSEELKSVPGGHLVRTAGQVIVRQRPRSAKGFVFLTLEDEVGTTNAILTPRQFRRFRAPLHSASIIQIVGPIQNQDGVIHVRVQHLEALARCEELPEGHDYH